MEGGQSRTADKWWSSIFGVRGTTPYRKESSALRNATQRFGLGTNFWKIEIPGNSETYITRSFIICTLHLILLGWLTLVAGAG
jgi:hypothetical protein